jgi:hypothetical protein
MLDLLAPRVLQRHRPRLEREFELDARTLRRARTVIERALRDGGAFTRAEVYGVLERAGIETARSRGLHILFALAHERVLCFGARRGRQPTFVLLDEWLPAAKAKPREEALAALAMRYFSGHAPATAADFAWWSGLTAKEANEAIALAGAELVREPAAARASARNVHLLPPFDEFTVAYKDRSDIVDATFAKRVNAGGGILNAVLVVNGLVVGTWKRTLRGKKAHVAVSPFEPPARSVMRAIDREIARYAAFVV